MVNIQNNSQKNTILSAGKLRLVIFAGKTIALTDEQWAAVKDLKIIKRKAAKRDWVITAPNEAAQSQAAETAEIFDLPAVPEVKAEPAEVLKDELKLPLPKAGRRKS